MATKYQADVTENINPAGPDYSILQRSNQVQGQMAQDVARARVGMAELIGKSATSLYEVYKAGEDQSLREKVTSTTEEFIKSRQQQALAIEPYMEQTSKANVEKVMQAFGASVSGSNEDQIRDAQYDLHVYLNNVKRLKDAVQGGMSNKEYMTRIHALTKEAITQNPSQADRIRGIVAQETGLQKDDVDANLYYVKEAFKPVTKGSDPLAEEKMAADVIKDMPKYISGHDELSLTRLYKTDRTKFNELNKTYLELKNIEITRAEQAKLLESNVRSDTVSVRQQIPSVVNLFYTDTAFALAKQTMGDGEEMYKMIDLVRKGNTDPNALKAYANAWSSKMIFSLRQARDRTFEYINRLKASRGYANSDALADMEKAVNDAFDRKVEFYSKDAEGTAAQYASIFAAYSNDSMEMNLKRVDASLRMLNLFPANVVKELFANGPASEMLKKRYPVVSKLVEQARAYVDTGTEDATTIVNAKDQYRRIEDAMKEFDTKVPVGEPLSPEVLEPATPQAKEEVKAAVELTWYKAEQALEKAELTEDDARTLSAAFGTELLFPAHKNQYEKKYKVWGKKLKETLSDSELMTIKQTMSNTTNRTMADVQNILKQVNSKYNTAFQVGVMPDGSFQLMSPTNTATEPEGMPQESAMMNSTVRIAMDEFKNKAGPLSRVAVLSRAMMTEENPMDIATEYALAINSDTPVKPWFDTTPVVPKAQSSSVTSNDMPITTQKVEPRPTSTAFTGGYERTIWDGKYGKTHNPDGTPKSNTEETGTATQSSNNAVEQQLKSQSLMPKEKPKELNVPAKPVATDSSKPFEVKGKPFTVWEKPNATLMPENIMLHHTATDNISKVINGFSARKQGKDEVYGVGAHYVVDKDGTIYKTTTDDSRVVYHVGSSQKKGFENVTNNNTLGIEIVGATSKDFTNEQIMAVKKLVGELRGRHGKLNVYGHGDISSNKMETEGTALAKLLK